MKFEHTETREDFGGTITVTAESRKEVIELSGHFRIFDKESPEELMQLAKAINAGRLVYASKPDAKRPWYLVESALDYEFTDPYRKLLEEVTGFDGEVPDMDLTPHHKRRLCHTHITSECGMESGHYNYKVLVQSQDWNGRAALDRAQESAEDYCQEDLGYRKFEREFIQAKNNTMIPNPDYLKRHRARPALGAPWLWNALFGWWREKHATAEQRAALDKADAIKAKSSLSENDWSLRSSGGPCHLVGTGGMYLNYDPAEFLKWEDFRTLGK